MALQGYWYEIEQYDWDDDDGHTWAISLKFLRDDGREGLAAMGAAATFEEAKRKAERDFATGSW